MTTVYFLTGSNNDQDNDFEFTITIPDKSIPSSESQYTLFLADISSENKLEWQTTNPTFLAGLRARMNLSWKTI